MNKKSLPVWLAGIVIIQLAVTVRMPSQETKVKQPVGRSREFLFTYGATVTKLEPNQEARIWIPVPPETAYQKVKVAFAKLPGKVKKTQEKTYGNRMFYIEAKANSVGVIPLQVTYRIKRFEVCGDLEGKGDKSGANEVFLQPNARVPISGKPLALVKNMALPKDELKLGKTLFDVVNGHMTYSKKGKGWGQGDAVWACDSKYGNCTDFHSLFISLARANKVPAKFEIGFAIPETRGKGEIGGYHCWAMFKPSNGGWIPVDISQASLAEKEKKSKLANYLFGNLTEDRVTFTTGRDLILSPQQSAGPLNYFIYPHVEVDGKVYPQENIRRDFSYQDTHYKVKKDA